MHGFDLGRGRGSGGGWSAAWVVALAAGAAAQTSVEPLASDDAEPREHRGSAVGLDGDRLAVGVPQEGNWVVSPGAVDVYLEVADAWQHEGRLRAGDGLARDRFGAALALSGERIAIGAPEHDALGWASGAVYVFRREGGAWIEEAKLLPGDLAEGDRFGASVDLEGDVLVVGAPQHVSSQAHSGAAYVYRRGANGWSLEQRFWYPSLANWADYGASVALSGERIAVGAPKQQHASQTSGLVHVVRHHNGAWQHEAALTNSLAEFDSEFGRSVDLRGAELVVGSRAEAAFVFACEPDGWHERQVLMTQDYDEADSLRFGHAVALGDGVLVVSATRGDEQHVFAGAVYVFRNDGLAWSEDHRLESPNGQAGAQFGHALAADERRALVGAPFESIGVHTECGRAYVFELGFAVEELCFGDGTGTICPCGNHGAPGHGCSNTVWSSGARLAHAGGSASFDGEGLTLAVAHSLPLETGMFLRSSALVNGGAGTAFGDGLRCVGSPAERLAIALTGRNGEATLELAPPDPTRVVVGGSEVLQWWFRDPAPLICGLRWNTSNAVRVVWQP